MSTIFLRNDRTISVCEINHLYCSVVFHYVQIADAMGHANQGCCKSFTVVYYEKFTLNRHLSICNNSYIVCLRMID